MTDKETFRQRNQLLVDELRSGRHAQGRGKLNRDGMKCCLGVACEVAIANGLELESVESELESGSRITQYGNGLNIQASVAPNEVCEWFGWDLYKTGDPAVRCPNPNGTFSQTSAIKMNDGMRLDFAEIADAFARTYVSPEGTTE